MGRRFRSALTCTPLRELIITIDGPSGTGKSTVSRAVALRARLPHLDTGAFYRAATLQVLRAGVHLDSPTDVADTVRSAPMHTEDGRMHLGDEDVSREIRGEPVTLAVSQVSANPDVRLVLVDRQREWVERHGGSAVVEGRDIGSVVFPNAEVKVYLDASPEVRARRRAQQMGDDPGSVLGDLVRRDLLDSTRETSPLTIPEGAVVIDTSDLGFEDVVEEVMSLLADPS